MDPAQAYGFFTDPDRNWGPLAAGRFSTFVDLPDGRRVDAWPIAMTAAAELAGGLIGIETAAELKEAATRFTQYLLGSVYTIDELERETGLVARYLWECGFVFGELREAKGDANGT